MTVNGTTSTQRLTVTGSATSTVGAGIQTTGSLDIDGTATSTFANGITPSAGCFRDSSGNCLVNNTIDSLEDLNDVADITEDQGDLLYWNGTEWRDIATSSHNLNTDDLVEGTINLFYSDDLVATYISGSSSIPHIQRSQVGDILYWNGSGWATTSTSTLGNVLDDRTDVDTTGKSPGDILSWNGTQWVDTSTSTLVADIDLGDLTVAENALVITGGTNAVIGDVSIDVDNDVEALATGQDALAALDRQPFDIALIDYRLPDTDGLTLLLAIRKRKLDIMTCMNTAYANIETAIAATRQGIDFFLPKPFSPEDLIGVTETLIRHKLLRKEAEELKKAHEASLLALASEKSQTHSLVTSLRDAVLVVNRTGEVVLANPAMGRLLRKEEDSLLRKPAAEVLAAEPFVPIRAAPASMRDG